MRGQFLSAGSACVGNFLVQAQHTQKNKMANTCRSLRKKPKIQVTYPYRIYWCKKMGQKSHTWAPLRIEHLRNIMSWILLPGTATKRSITQHAYGSLLANFSKTPKSCDVVALSFIHVIPSLFCICLCSQVYLYSLLRPVVLIVLSKHLFV